MYKYQSQIVFLITFLPAIAYAQGTSLQNLFKNLLEFFSGVIIPFLFGIAFLFIVINVFRYFILGGHDEDGQKRAKGLALYGVAAFVFLVVFFGVVNLLSDAIGLGGAEAPCPDYMEGPEGCQ
ncbi:MAG TPA: hypothetical protein PKA42_03785 [Candidatus Paceibacterota bacterium]|nr:hypothetical protein [Candidatus Paceibacterota bacterium]HMO83259.1 hypothetical protein [Candidatus Paceibacterota bacterium]